MPTIKLSKKRIFNAAKNLARYFVKVKPELFGEKVLSAYYLNEGSGHVRELVNNEALPLEGTGANAAAWADEKNGIYFPYNGGTGDGFVKGPSVDVSNGITICFRANMLTNSRFLLCQSTGTPNYALSVYRLTGGGMRFYYGASLFKDVGVNWPSAITDHCITVDAAGNFNWYYGDSGSYSSSGVTLVPNTELLNIGRRETSLIDGPDATLEYAYFLEGAISKENWQRLRHNPSLILEPRFYSFSFTSNDNTASIPDGSLVLTGYAPVTDDGYSLVNIPDGALSLTGYAPTFDNGAGNTVTLSTGSLILTGYAPTFETVSPQECAFIAQSSLPLGFIGTEGAFTAESDLLAYQTQESAFTAQSILNVYSTWEGDFTAESILNAYVPQQSDFIAQSANTIYLDAVAQFTAQSALNSYSAKEASFVAQSAIDVYQESEGIFIAQSSIDAFITWVGNVTYQSALNAYEPKQAEFIAQSAIDIYKAFASVFVAQSELEIYIDSESEFTAQSAIDAYVSQNSEFIAESELFVYLPNVGVFTAQSALNAYEVFYTFATNLETGATTEYTGFNFNSVSGDIAANENGLYQLTGADDAGTAISTSIEPGKFEPSKIIAGTSNLSRLTDAYLGVSSDGNLLLTVTTGSDVNTYTLTPTTTLDTVKADLARKPKGRYWTVKVENVSGSTMELDSIELLPQILSRRV